jgi:hypothetical protein
VAGAIYLVRGDELLVEMSEEPYDSEALLQSLLAKHPALLAADQIGGLPRRWLLVSREMAVPAQELGGGRWSADHLFLDQDGVPTIVEVKRAADNRIRREVVGQMLDYAANGVVYWPAERLRATFEANAEKQQRDPAALVADVVGDDGGVERFWETVATNLRAGKVRLVFVSDQIPTELRRIIEFLNVQMSPAEVLGVEVKQYVGGDLRTLVPRVVGQTAEAEQKKRPTGARAWDYDSFFQLLGEHRPEAEVNTARQLFQWATDRGLSIRWGRGVQHGSLMPVLEQEGVEHGPIVLYTDGSVEVPFQRMARRTIFDDVAKREQLRARLNQIPGVVIGEDAIDRRPQFRLAALVPESANDALKATLGWYFDQITVQEPIQR